MKQHTTTTKVRLPPEIDRPVPPGKDPERYFDPELEIKYPALIRINPAGRRIAWPAAVAAAGGHWPSKQQVIEAVRPLESRDGDYWLSSRDKSDIIHYHEAFLKERREARARSKAATPTLPASTSRIGRPITTTERKTIINAYIKGKPPADITKRYGKRYGLSTSSINKIIKRYEKEHPGQSAVTASGTTVGNIPPTSDTSSLVPVVPATPDGEPAVDWARNLVASPNADRAAVIYERLHAEPFRPFIKMGRYPESTLITYLV